jgi:hypothetical protein
MRRATLALLGGTMLATLACVAPPQLSATPGAEAPSTPSPEDIIPSGQTSAGIPVVVGEQSEAGPFYRLTVQRGTTSQPLRWIGREQRGEAFRSDLAPEVLVLDFDQDGEPEEVVVLRPAGAVAAPPTSLATAGTRPATARSST